MRNYRFIVSKVLIQIFLNVINAESTPSNPAEDSGTKQVNPKKSWSRTPFSPHIPPFVQDVK
jgi:hypothetical protein